MTQEAVQRKPAAAHSAGGEPNPKNTAARRQEEGARAKTQRLLSMPAPPPSLVLTDADATLHLPSRARRGSAACAPMSLAPQRKRDARVQALGGGGCSADHSVRKSGQALGMVRVDVSDVLPPRSNGPLVDGSCRWRRPAVAANPHGSPSTCIQAKRRNHARLRSRLWRPARGGRATIDHVVVDPRCRAS